MSAHYDQLKDALINDHGSDGAHSGVLTGEQFQDLIRDAKMQFSEYEIDLLTMYAIKGSKRLTPGVTSNDQHHHVNVKTDLIQFYNLMKSLEPVVKHMRKEDDE